MTTFDLENPNPQPGDSLRDSVANLLTGRFGRPIPEAIIRGKRVDLYFEYVDLGRTCSLYVEAKDWAKPLSRKDVVGICTDYSGLLLGPSPAELLIVTRFGVTPGARSFIDSQPAIRHQTIWQLEDGALGMTEYERYLATLYEEDGLSSYYVEGRIRKATYKDRDQTRIVSSRDLNAIDVIGDWIEGNDSTPIAVLGAYGAGKTSFAKRLVAKYAKQALHDPTARRPVLIRLGAFARCSSLEAILAEMFAWEFPIHGFSVRRFMEINKLGRFLIVLDGFDEMKHAMTWGDFRYQLTELHKLITPLSRVLLLGRPSALLSMDEHALVFRGAKRLRDQWMKIDGWPEFQEFELQDFSPGEREKFVRRYLHHRVSRNLEKRELRDSEIDARAAQVNELAELEPDVFAKPVHVKILTDLSINPRVDLSGLQEGVSRWQLYELFFESLVDREVSKGARRFIGEQDRSTFQREVAFWLWSARNGSTSFSAEDLPQDIVAQLPDGDATDATAKLREYLTGAAIEKKSGDIYYFRHRSFAEFLVAQRMVLKQPVPQDHEVYSSVLYDGVLSFLKEAPYEESFVGWADTLGTARGQIGIPYINFLADKRGGIKNLIRAWQSESPLRAVLTAFDDHLAFSPKAVNRLFGLLRSLREAEWGMALQLLHAAVPQSLFRSSPALPRLAASLLDRVFDSARERGHSASYSINPKARIALATCKHVFSVSRKGRDAALMLDSNRVMAQAEGIVRNVAVDFGVPFHMSSPDAAKRRVPVREMLEFAKLGNAPKIRRYFEYHDNFDGLIPAA